VSLAVALTCGLWLLYRLDERPHRAPDSEQYLTMSRGGLAPLPFCGRWLVPLVARSPLGYQISTDVGLVGQGIAIALWCESDWRAVVLLAGLPGLWRFSCRHPILVDPLPFAGLILAAWRGSTGASTAELVAWSLVLGAAREQAPVWLALFLGSPWPLFGLLGPLPGLWRHKRRAVEADSLWLTAPLQTALSWREGHWLRAKVMLLPWGIVLPLALVSQDPWVVILWAISLVPLFVTSDWSRLYSWSAPYMIKAALTVSLPAAVWPLLLLAHVFNPYRGS
jgi:hypothetical protein